MSKSKEMKIKEHLIFYKVCKVIVLPIFKLIFRYKTIRECELPKDGSYIIACNHLSYTDPVFVGLTHKRRAFFMAKSELFMESTARPWFHQTKRAEYPGWSDGPCARKPAARAPRHFPRPRR